MNYLKSITILGPLVGLIALNSSCTKTEGLGGAGQIKGTVIVKDYNSLGTLVSEYEAQDEKVYIIYGDEDNITDEDVSTSFDGTFEFNYLRTGNYTIYAYSSCVSCPNGQDSVVSKSVTINSKKDIQELSDIIIRK